jgi:hypothetical protein
VNEFTCLGDLIDPQKYQRKIHRRFQILRRCVARQNKSLARHHKPQSHGSGNTPTPPRHERPMQHHLADPDYDPRRRSYLAFARLVGRFLLYGDLGVISALNQHQLAALTMDRDDALFWLSLFWFVALCGLAIWMLLSA